MHIPDGFINTGVSVGAGVVAVGALSVCVRKTAEVMEEKQAPLAGLVAAFIFAVQMLNFPVASGTSGHLLGGVLAAVLVGPWVGALCVAVVLVVQALLFADGGLSALGLNIVNMALVTAFGGYAVFAAGRKVLPKSRTGVMVASGVAAGRRRGAGVGRLHPRVRHRRHGRGVGRHRGRGHGGHPRAHRHRRGPDHRPHGRRRARGAPRPGVGAPTSCPSSSCAPRPRPRRREPGQALRLRRRRPGGGARCSPSSSAPRREQARRAGQGGHRPGLHRHGRRPRPRRRTAGRLRRRGRRRRGAEHRPGRGDRRGRDLRLRLRPVRPRAAEVPGRRPPTPPRST